MNKPLRKALKGRGASADLARRAKVTRAAVANWIFNAVPAERVVQLEKLTGVPRELLRPDLYKR